MPKKLSPNIKRLISQSLIKQQHQREQEIKKAQEQEKENLEKKKHLKKTNDNIRKRNAKCKAKLKGKLHKKAWGVDQRQFDNSQDCKKLRAKIRTERQKTQKKGRARIGLEAYKGLKAKKNASQIIIETKTGKEHDPDVLKYMKLKKKQNKIVHMTEVLEGMLKDNEREKALYDLFCKTKKKPSKRKHDVEGLEYIDEALKLKRDKLKKKQDSYKAQRMSLNDAVLIIQRWWRRTRPINIELKTPDDDIEEEKIEEFADSFPVAIPKSGIVKQIKKMFEDRKDPLPHSENCLLYTSPSPRDS